MLIYNHIQQHFTWYDIKKDLLMSIQMFTHTPMTMIRKQMRFHHEGYSMPWMKSWFSWHLFSVQVFVHISIWILSHVNNTRRRCFHYCTWMEILSRVHCEEKNTRKEMRNPRLLTQNPHLHLLAICVKTTPIPQKWGFCMM